MKKQASKLPKNWHDQLMNEGIAERKKTIDKQFHSLLTEAEAIPLRTKAQYPLYLEGRLLHLIRGVAEVDGVSVQNMMRRILQDGVDLRMKKSKTRSVRGG